MKLGASLAEVRRALGRETLVNRRVPRGFGAVYLELDWDYGQWNVGLVGRPNRMRVVRVATLKQSERTAQGIGIGSRLQAVRRAFPLAQCLTYSRSRMEIRHPGGVKTRFFVETDSRRYSSAPFLVYDISVEAPDAPRLPLEARSRTCPAEWFSRG